MRNIEKYFKGIYLNASQGAPHTIDQLIEEWSCNPEAHFFGYYQQPLVWDTVYGVAPLEGLPDTHGYSTLPDIKCSYSRGQSNIKIGWVEGISMHSGGVVTVRHFALASELSRFRIGVIFFEALIRFFKKNNALTIEFHESHTSKINHYRRFFEKISVAEISDCVWKVDLYEHEEIPIQVVQFQTSLMR
jgi:hypothetical protein